MADCRQCADFDWCVEYEECGLFKQKPITNADRIRHMTDEELAEFYQNLYACPPGENVCECCFGRPDSPSKELCDKCWLNWLKQEATDG